MLDQLYPEKCQEQTDKLEMHHHQDGQPRTLGQDRQPGAPGYGGEPRASGQGLQPGQNGISEVSQSGPQDHQATTLAKIAFPGKQFPRIDFIFLLKNLQLMRPAKLRYTAGGRRSGVGAGGGSAVQTSGCPAGFPGMPGIDEQAGCAPSPGTAGPQVVPGNDIQQGATEQDGQPGEPGTFIINSARVPGPPGSPGQLRQYERSGAVSAGPPENHGQSGGPGTSIINSIGPLNNQC